MGWEGGLTFKEARDGWAPPCSDAFVDTHDSCIICIWLMFGLKVKQNDVAGMSDLWGGHE